MRRISLIFLVFIAVLLLSSFRWTEADTSIAVSKEASAPAAVQTTRFGQLQSLLRLSAMPKVFMEDSNIPHRKDIRHVRKAAADADLEVMFAVRHKNLDKLEAALYDVSDPKSANYGKHWTKEQVEELVVDTEAARILRESLTEAGFEIVEEKSNGEFLKVRGKVGDMERLFNTEFHEYIYEYKGPEQKKVLEERVIFRAEKYHLPEMLAAQVESVFDVVQAPIPIFRVGNLRADTTADVDTQATNYVTPSLINSYYSVTSNVGNSLTDQAFYGTINQTMSPSDLTKFQTFFGLPVQALNTSIGGHVNDNTCITTPDDCGEANLDVQYLIGIANTIPTTYYYTDLDWIDWIIEVNDMTNPPDVISISYGSNEIDIDLEYASEFSYYAQQLGLKGVTILVSSGDDGAPGAAVGYGEVSSCGYYPEFPTSCPYIVSVGATQVSWLL
jgi:tripeptidyl-peptidase-1